MALWRISARNGGSWPPVDCPGCWQAVRLELVTGHPLPKLQTLIFVVRSERGSTFGQQVSPLP